MEEWKDVVGYEGHYQISSEGRLKSVERKVKHKTLFNGQTKHSKILKLNISKGGYLFYVLQKDKNRQLYLIHRLVYEAFNGPIPYGMDVDHINSIRADNRINNLQLLTRRDNIRKAYAKRELPLGVYRTKSGQYIARHFINGETINLGTYKTIKEAQLAHKLYEDEKNKL